VERDFFTSSYQRSALYRPHIVAELRKAGLPEELSWLPLVESGFKIGALSTARALGLWQFIPSTGYKYGMNRDDWVDERMDFEKSTRAAIDYLKELHTMFGDWLTVLAAYNCGEGRVIRTIASQHINYLDRFWDLYRKLPNETARYVPRFLATVLVVRDPQKYGMDLGSLNAPPLSYETVEIHKSMRLQDIAKKLEIPEETLNILNAELRHRITPDRPYRLRVPAEKAAQLLATMDEVPGVQKPFPGFAGGRGSMVRHRVRQGETLASIARKYDTSVQAIRAGNKLSAKHPVVAGQRLNILIPTRTAAVSSGQAKKAEEAVLYRVQKGDTLSSLARKHGTTVAELRKANGLTGEALKIGQALRIGGGPREEGQAKKSEGGGEGRGAAATETAKVRKYTVQKGDSLNKIARENDIPLDRLLDLNRLAIQDRIHPGQVIRIQ
jgi:membrane-bound lytic murein transglycosylase D